MESMNFWVVGQSSSKDVYRRFREIYGNSTQLHCIAAKKERTILMFGQFTSQTKILFHKYFSRRKSVLNHSVVIALRLWQPACRHVTYMA
jgi:hypothetical protein